MNATKHHPFLWPDHIISKPESRRLREEHNALYNSHAELLQVCNEELEALETWIQHETVRGDVLEGMLISRQKITAAISKAKGNQ